MCGLGCNRFFNIVLSLAGIGLSAFALYVEKKMEEDENFVPMCDISEEISCSVVFSSKYARGFGLIGPYLGEEHPLNQPNPVYGVAFFSIMAFLSLFNRRFIATLQVLLSLASCAMSCYLGYLLHFVIKSVCLICVATYAVNFLLFVFSICKRRMLKGSVSRQTKFGYYIPTTNTPNNNNFKKFI